MGSRLLSAAAAVVVCWSCAAPDAPFDYTVRERIARERGRGVWGFEVDAITRQR